MRGKLFVFTAVMLCVGIMPWLVADAEIDPQSKEYEYQVMGIDQDTEHHFEGVTEADTYSGSFDISDPTWNRIIGTSTDPACAATSVDSSIDGQYYEAIPIFVTATENLAAEVTAFTGGDSVIAVYCDPFDSLNPATNLVAYDDDGGVGFLSAFVDADGVQLNPGNQYWFIMTTFTNAVIGDYDIAFTSPTVTVGLVNQAPPNDLCVDAIELTCPQGGGTDFALGSTVDATFTDQGTCDTSHTAPEVWYTVAGNGGEISVTTCAESTNYDTKITVWSGDCAAPVCVAGNDDDFECSFNVRHSTVTWPSVVGVDYFIMVHGFAAVGDFELTMTCEVPVELQSISIE
jgi:hypothetical protein